MKEVAEKEDEITILKNKLISLGYTESQCIDSEAMQYLNSRLYASEEEEIEALKKLPDIVDKTIENVKEVIKTSRISYSNPMDEKRTLEDISLNASADLGKDISKDCGKFVKSAILQSNDVDVDDLFHLYVTSRASLIEREAVFADAIYKYIKTIVPVIMNGKKMTQNAHLKVKRVRNKVSDILCREEFDNARKFASAKRYRLIKCIEDRDGEYFTVCPDCGKTVRLENGLCSLITLKTEHARPTKAYLTNLNACECGTALTLRPEEYLNLSMSYDKECRRAISSVISSGEMITSQVISGISFGYLKDISPELFVNSVNEKSVTIVEEKERDRNIISDEEFRDAAEIFYKLLESKVGRFNTGNTKRNKIQGSNLNTDESIGITKNSVLYYPTLKDKENAEGIWTKKDAAMFISQYLGYSYSLEYKVALFSAIRFIAENSLLKEAFSNEILEGFESDLTLLKGLSGKTSIESVDANLRDSVGFLLDKCSNVNKDFATRVQNSITLLEDCIERQRSVNSKVFATVMECKDVLCFIPRLKITNISAKELLAICSSETKISLLDDVANMIIVRKYASEYFKEWSVKFIDRAATAKNVFEISAETQKSLDGIRKLCETLTTKYHTPEINNSYNYVFEECINNERMTDKVAPRLTKCVNAINSYDVQSIIDTLTAINSDDAIMNLPNNLGLSEELFNKKDSLNTLGKFSIQEILFKDFVNDEVRILERAGATIDGSVVPVRFVGETPLEYCDRIKDGKEYLSVNKLCVLSEFISELTKIQLIHLFNDDYNLKTSFIYHVLIDNCDKKDVLPYYGINSLQYNINKHSEPIIKSFQKSCTIWKAINKHYSEPLQSFFAEKIVKVTNTNISVNDDLSDLDTLFDLYSSIGTALGNDFAALSVGNTSVDLEIANAEMVSAFGMNYVDLLHYFGIKTEE